MSKLKPCPFCGGEAEIETEEYGGTANWVNKVYCVKGCVIMDDQYGPPKKAVKRWNDRSADKILEKIKKYALDRWVDRKMWKELEKELL